MVWIAFIVLFGLFGIGIGFFFPGAVLLAALQSKLRTRRARRAITQATVLKAEYDIHASITPAEASFLYYGRATLQTQAALLFELETAKAATITPNKAGLNFTKLPADTDAWPAYLQLFYEKLPASGTFSKASINAVDDQFVQRQMRDHMVRSGYIIDGGFFARIAKQTTILSLVTSLIMCVMLTFVMSQSTDKTGIDYSVNGRVVDHFDIASSLTFGVAFGFFTFFMSFPQIGAAITLYYYRLGIPKGATQKFKDEWVRILGYREYLTLVEQDNLQFAIQEGHQADHTMLAYAYALGLLEN